MQIETERLIIRSLKLEDEQAFSAIIYKRKEIIK